MLLSIIRTYVRKEKIMKSSFVLTAVLGATLVGAASAADITIYYSPTCPHCHHAREFIENNLVYEYPSINVTEVNVTLYDNQNMFSDVLKKCEYESGGVPVIVIGDKCFQGYAGFMQTDMRDAIEVDMSDDNKNFAKNVVSEMAKDAEAYKSSHQSEAAKITEYTAKSADKKKITNTGSVIGFYALLIILVGTLGFMLVRKPKKK